MAEQLDLDALKQALINSAMGLTFRECHALIDYAQSLEADNLELCGIAQAADAQRRTLESASQPGIDALATAMHHAAIKYASGDLVDFQHEAREFLLASQPGSGEDTARLDYLIDDGAVVDTITNFEGEKRYQLSWPDLGESQNVWYHSARVAIDASRASLDGRREV